MAWDPIGIAGIPEAADEYDCMVSPLMHLLHDGASERAIRKWIVKEVKEHFGLRPKRQREFQVATKVVNWWTQRAIEP
jgi:hypothetical protein